MTQDKSTRTRGAQLERDAAKTLAVVERLLARGEVSPPLDAELTDLKAWSAYARYFAHKLRAGVTLARARRDRDTEAQRQAIRLLEEARSHWQRLADLGERYNQLPVLSSAKEPFSWAALIPAVEADLELARAALPSPPARSDATPDAFPTERDPLLWPFRQDSIWNMPIGDGAVYVPTQIPPQKQVQPEEDILLLDLNAPRIPIYHNAVTWRGPSRYPGKVDTNRVLVADAPIPPDFVVLDYNMNYACAILRDDGVTIRQNQPFTRAPGWPFATSAHVYPEDNLITGDGIKGAHGGSGMSSLGGTIRLGELLPDAPPIRHALKVCI